MHLCGVAKSPFLVFVERIKILQVCYRDCIPFQVMFRYLCTLFTSKSSSIFSSIFGIAVVGAYFRKDSIKKVYRITY